MVGESAPPRGWLVKRWPLVRQSRTMTNASGAEALSDEALEEEALAIAKTLAPDAADQTFRPGQTGSVRPGMIEQLPEPALLPSKDALPEDTAVFYERVLRPQSDPPAGGTEAYEIVGQVGKGGMGEVWRAVQRSLGREVALKRLTTDDASAATQFLSEARVTARLAHSNIIPVHALGRSGDGRPMLAMKLVKGTSWSDLLRSEVGPRDLRRHLGIFVSVCNAVAFAHAEGFLHRDLKPANVMVADYGQVFVLDWGLAVGLDRKLCDEQGILHVHDVRGPAGTPAYMAPELSRGDGIAQGPRTDVYLLGACLHEIVTGSPPHSGRDTLAALRHAMDCPPPEYDESVPRELADICRRALAKLPSDRYPDVVTLRGAVEAFLAHHAARSITEKGARALERLRALIAAPAGPSDSEKQERTQAIHRTYTEARFAFEHALESWAEDGDARVGLVSATRVMLDFAIASQDLALAMRLDTEVEDEALHARVEALRAKVRAREAELVALREQAHMLDDKRVARPVGRVFIVAGVLGGAAIFPTRYFLDHLSEHGTAPITALWTVTTLVTGLHAFFVLRRGKKSLVSSRIGWTWAGVGFACLVSGAVAIAQGAAPFTNASYTTMMIGIGFVAQAMQTRRWLLLPAFGTFVAALLMGFFPARNVEIFGALWIVTLMGVGVALRRGARLDGEAPSTGRPS